MPQLSLTDFVDVVSRSGTPKANKVAEIKHRPPYQPAFDFYKAVRDGIVATHENARPKSFLVGILGRLSDPKKVAAYPEIISGYKRWWGAKMLKWFPPPSGLFSEHGIDIAVNPELGLEINGQRHLVKLYFKADPLAKNRIDIITHLMAVALGPDVANGTTMSVLDIRNSRLISPTVPIPHLKAMLSAEEDR
jgi:hypothetical protein